MEAAALRAMEKGGLLDSGVDERSSISPAFRDELPGKQVFARLARGGFCFLTEEDLIDPSSGPDGDRWTPTWELTDQGRALLRQMAVSEQAQVEQRRAAKPRR